MTNNIDSYLFRIIEQMYPNTIRYTLPRISRWATRKTRI